MRIESDVSLAALGPGPWVPVNYHQRNFKLSLAGTMDNGASAGTGTWEVQMTFDNPNQQPAQTPTSLTRAGAVATVVLPNHGGRTGDCVIVTSSGDPVNLDTQLQQSGNNPPLQLGADITVVDVNTFTYAVPNAGATAGLPGTKVTILKVFNHATLQTLTAATYGSQEDPVMAVRPRVTVAGAGTLRLTVLQAQGGPGG